MPVPTNIHENRTVPEHARALNRFLEGLPQASRLIFLRRYWFCDSTAEIARRYGIPPGLVKLQLRSLRRRLAEFMAGEGFAA